MPSATPKSSSPYVVLGVAGGIAAYKSVELLRRLRDRGYDVAPVLTPDALRFVGALTFSALASEPTRVTLHADPTTPSPHTTLARRADLIVVAPATAHLIARYALGLADDLLCATLLASRGPVLLCPAMHTEMWEQPSVQTHLATLRARGVMVLEPESGPLAGGDEGVGRLVAPERIEAAIVAVLEGHRGDLTGRRVVVSAGGTREALDPVRVLSNRSSGRQGYALAEVAARRGAAVTLVSTVDRPLALDVARVIDVVRVESAAQLHEAVLAHAASADVVVMAAAVADFTAEASPTKLKRRDGAPSITLTPTLDVVADLVARRRPAQVLVAFAAETNDVLENASAKLRQKSVDLLVANDVAAAHAGFEHETNEVWILAPGAETQRVALRSKEAVATVIFDRVAAVLSQGDQ